MEGHEISSASLPIQQPRRYVPAKCRTFAAIDDQDLPSGPWTAHLEEALLMPDDYEHPGVQAPQSRLHPGERLLWKYNPSGVCFFCPSQDLLNTTQKDKATSRQVLIHIFRRKSGFSRYHKSALHNQLKSMMLAGVPCSAVSDDEQHLSRASYLLYPLFYFLIPISSLPFLSFSILRQKIFPV